MTRRSDRACWQARVLAAFALLLAGGARAQVVPGSGPNLFDIYNDYGDIGLLQTPTARTADDGEFGGGVSETFPYAQLHLTLQPLPWLETAVRYTEVLDVPYSAGSSIPSHDHYKDRSLDFKVHLIKEGRFLPAFAIGIQDIGGTGLFQGEYMVFSRRYYDFDFSLGLGWGRMGSRGGVPNPFGVFGQHFRNPRGAVQSGGGAGTPGGLGLSRLFTGNDTSLFGGVRWRTPLHGLYVDVEFDGNNYHSEEAFSQFPGAKITAKLPVNAGLTYRVAHAIDLTVGYERGNKVMAHVMLHTNFETLTAPPKLLDPLPPPLFARPAEMPSPPGVAQKPPLPAVPPGGGARAPLVTAATDDDTIIRSLAYMFGTQELTLVAASLHDPGNTVTIWFEQNKYRNPAKAIGRAARVLTEFAPPRAEFFRLIEMHAGMELYRVTVERAELEKAASGNSSPEEILVSSSLEGGRGMPDHAQYPQLTPFPKFFYDVGPAYRQNIGSPNGFYFYQFYLNVGATVRLRPNWDVEGAVGINLYNNFNSLAVLSNSRLPHVRSDIDQYLKDGKNDLVQLETNYFWSPRPRLYTRVSAGIFEEMFGGVSAALLYRPFNNRLAIGLDVASLRQRSFNQRLNFQKYATTTAFLDLYYDWPYMNVTSQLTIGRYLARDEGATISVARRFRSGVVAGAFVTKTNVSSAQFGEGSFDKGIFISVPLDVGLPLSTRRTASVLFRPVTRDGGQRAFDGPDLYAITSGANYSDIDGGWADFLQ